MTLARTSKDRWCVVIADNHGSARFAVRDELGEASVPMVHSRLGNTATLLQEALQRATRIAQSSQVMVTTHEEYRPLWEPALLFVRPEHRFIATSPEAATLTVATSILAICKRSLSSIVVLLPAQCHIVQDAVVTSAIEHACLLLPSVREGIITLGMGDIEDAPDEDYLIPDSARNDPTLEVLGLARRPTVWVARHLRDAGAMVASGILVGYAGVFAAHLSKYCPGLAAQLEQTSTAAADTGNECDVALHELPRLPRLALAALTWRPPILRQRALCVWSSGWNGLRSPRSIERLVRHYGVKESPQTSPRRVPIYIAPECESPVAQNTHAQGRSATVVTGPR